LGPELVAAEPALAVANVERHNYPLDRRVDYVGKLVTERLPRLHSIDFTLVQMQEPDPQMAVFVTSMISS
jgi:hypothetical protein